MPKSLSMKIRRYKTSEELFQLSNDTPIHCDSDFQPLIPEKIVKQLVRILANNKPYDATHTLKDSHESEPIQITDILCGALKQHVIDKNGDFLVPWEFHNKLKTKSAEKTAKCYLWKFNGQ